MVTEPDVEAVPEDWSRALAVVAHPDDLEYGAASAIARWTDQGKHIAYLLATRGEAGISSMPPERAGPIREDEQRRSAAVVGVDTVEFLDHADGLLVEGIDLRRDLAHAIRRHRPEILIGINHRDSWGGPSWNHVDHRALGRSLLDAARDAGNPWVFREPDMAEPWDGVRFAIFGGSPQSTHGVDVTEYIDRGIASLAEHAAYLAALPGGTKGTEPGSFLRDAAGASGPRLGVPLATLFEFVSV